MKWFKHKRKTNQKCLSQTESNLLSIENNVCLLIDRKNVRPFYDSEWEIKVSKQEDSFTCRIIRMDDEKASNIAELIHKMPYEKITRECIMSLDQKNQIFYD